jgi:hypothetical protein
MGTNDLNAGTPTQVIADNLRWMIGRWTAAGRSPNRFIITTLAPINSSSYGHRVPKLNDLIRALANSTGVGLIDLAAHTSNDNGRTWKSASLHVGDRLHYAEHVREWLAEQVVRHINRTIPAQAAASVTASAAK